ncbi:MAG TPA: peptide chain release factor N(5)-glutamine methyltransferase, partial [Bacteroidales bacterium]|nr:peptide chain release factor N(5)-glutamine methyltransferase [Bacteroidales bacterium]
MTSNITIKKAIFHIKSELKNIYPENEIISLAYIILEELLNISKTKIISNIGQNISTETYQNVNHIISQLKLFKPIQYILGKAEFYNLHFYLSESVLIPRPETEELVDWIVKENPRFVKKILDIGTGSGCISISLAKNLPAATVSACDISDDALAITRKNSKLNHVNLQIFKLNILDINQSLNEKFDIIVSNPPYVTEKEKSLMHPNVLNYEPQLALFVSDENPLIFYRSIIN